MYPRTNLQPCPADAACGTLEYTENFHSALLGNERRLVVYLPPGYYADEDRRYPVLYMQDGQNLFDGRTSFVPGQHWHLAETADNLIHEGAIEPLIIVGVYNAGERRIEEYTPSADPNFKVGGQADAYGRMLAEELKPFIDGAYRTKPEREHTGIGGSSLGGLVSLYLGLRRGDTFGRVLAMSPSLWWDKCWLLRNVDELARGPKSKIWIDAGTLEGANTDCNAEALRDALVERGFAPGEEVEFMRAEGARHSEQDWAHRVHHGLRFTFAARAEDRDGPSRPFPPPVMFSAHADGAQAAV
ncbi:MAG TPA: alpha/beta hydrolase-fold protein [Pyrinomonadaceae bacterium]|nr:alpha/beta hydrolase-fold protein [Pyrinomonadaceae bacterium]